MISQYSDMLQTSLFFLSISSVASIVVAYGVFSYCENLAKKRGIIDRKAEG